MPYDHRGQDRILIIGKLVIARTDRRLRGAIPISPAVVSISRLKFLRMSTSRAIGADHPIAVAG